MVALPGVRALVLCLGAGLAAQTQSVSPPQYETAVGAWGTPDPFWTQGRWQQIDANLRGPARTIRGLAWRRGAWGSVRRTLEFELAMAESDRTQASAVFANNYATPPSLVFARRPMVIPDEFGFAWPMAFDVQAPFDVPFPFSGARDVLWEAVVHANAYALPMEGFDDANPEISGSWALTGTGCSPSFSLYQVSRVAQGFLTIDWTVDRAPRLAPATLLLGTTNPDLPIPGLCARLHTDGAVGLPFVTNAYGYAYMRVWLAWSSGFRGITMTAQAAVFDAARPGLPLWLSDGSRALIPDVWQPSQVTHVYGVNLPAVRGILVPGQGLVTRFTF